jgi:hydrogenase maturation factor
MCINVPLKVLRIEREKAVMEDGREVRVGLVKDIKIGDYLEVYGDLALGKVMKRIVKSQRLVSLIS